MAELPKCRNNRCPAKGTNTRVILLGEGDDHWLFGCDGCKGIQYVTKPVGWRRAEQENSYRRTGRPEYARERAFFFLGRHHG